MSELIDALNQLEKEKHIDKDVIMEAIENSLVAACKKRLWKCRQCGGRIWTVRPEILSYTTEKEVVETADGENFDPALQISLAKAKAMDPKYELGDIVRVEITPKDFGKNCCYARQKCHCTEDQRRRKKSCL